MYKVIMSLRGEVTFTMIEGIDNAKSFIDRYQKAMRDAGQIQGRDFEIELEAK